MKKLSSLSVVFPAYSDGGTIASMISTDSIVCRELTDDLEIIVVDDGSTDYTALILDDMNHRCPELW